MDIWSWEEIQACHAQLYKQLDISTVSNRFTCFGGSVRFVLGKPEYSFEEDLRPQVSSSELDPLMRLDLAGMTDELSHKLVHIRVRIIASLTGIERLFHVILGEVTVQ